ncbi:efflux RND transporter periplasmic adaptor subunit [Roseateles chitinivorans]|uniref:efflux RND transporter periplasmic adaptor subunit n=1 Tax=Roseateles chitinivorans TaxID=2917965 RepID=UPI003D66F162
MTLASNDGRHSHRRRLALAATAVAAGLAVAAVAAFGVTATTSGPAGAPGGKSAAAAASAAPVPVSLAVAGRRDMPVWTEGVGSVTSLNVVSVRSRVDGQLERVLYTEGQQVKAGDLLAVVDPRPFQAQVQQAQAVLAQENAKLASLRVDLRRAEELASAGAGPRQTVDTLQAQVATQAAAVQAAQAVLQTAQLQLTFTRITAPAAGRTGQRLVPAGSMVHASDVTGLTTITQMNPVWVSFQVPQDVLTQVVDQGRARRLSVEALARDRSRTLGKGELEFVDSQVTAATGQVMLKARFDNAGDGLWPGQLVAVRMLLKTEANATVVPDAALQQGPAGSFVYVVDGQRQAQARAVQVGSSWNGSRLVRTGLKPGETVVTQGQYRIAPGIPVTDAATLAPATGDPAKVDPSTKTVASATGG